MSASELTVVAQLFPEFPPWIICVQRAVSIPISQHFQRSTLFFMQSPVHIRLMHISAITSLEKLMLSGCELFVYLREEELVGLHPG